jgi:hypothetical protein
METKTTTSSLPNWLIQADPPLQPLRFQGPSHLSVDGWMLLLADEFVGELDVVVWLCPGDSTLEVDVLESA